MRRPLLVVAASLVLAAAYAGYWLYAASTLRDELDAFRAGHPDQWAWRTVEIGGFPLAFRLQFADAVARGNTPIPYAAAAATIIATAAPFALREWRIVAPDGVQVDAPALPAGLVAAALDGEVSIGGDGSVVALTAHELTGRGAATGFAAELLTARVSVPVQKPQSHRDTAFALSANLLQAAIPSTLPTQRLDALSLEATFKGRLAPGPLAPGLAAWRDDGGTLEIDDLHIAWGGATIDLDGTLALDASLQPIGALTATIVGADKLVDAAVATGAVQARHAGTVKSVLRAISSPAKGDGALRVPLTLQDRHLYVGPAAIAVLPLVSWP